MRAEAQVRALEGEQALLEEQGDVSGVTSLVERLDEAYNEFNELRLPALDYRKARIRISEWATQYREAREEYRHIRSQLVGKNYESPPEPDWLDEEVPLGEFGE